MIDILILKNTSIDNSPLMAGEIETVRDADAEILVGMGKAEFTKKLVKNQKKNGNRIRRGFS
tara:strand:- start:282 stop:467 length:186 start_codon:yes stop_codon:yes gene_type:complete